MAPGWAIRLEKTFWWCNVGYQLGVSQSEGICIAAYGRFFTGLGPPMQMVLGRGDPEPFPISFRFASVMAMRLVQISLAAKYDIKSNFPEYFVEKREIVFETCRF